MGFCRIYHPRSFGLESQRDAQRDNDSSMRTREVDQDFRILSVEKDMYMEIAQSLPYLRGASFRLPYPRTDV